MSHAVEGLPTPGTYARILLQQRPQHSREILRGTGLQRADLARSERISVAQQLQIFHNATTLENIPEWGLRFGKRLNISSHGPLGFAALSAPTIGDGLGVFADFARSRAPYIDLRAERGKDYYRLHAGSTMPLGDLETPMAEVLLLIAEAYVLAVLDYAPGNAMLSFAYPAPSHARLYGEYFSLPYQFDTGGTFIQVPLGACAMPCPLHDQQTYQSALAQCREALATVIDPRDAASRVRNLLSAHFDQVGLETQARATPGLDYVASTLCISTRTLIRQLELQGTSYRRILEELQLATAGKLLDQARYSISDIGELLGYSDAANFGRAFRRWSGMAPGSYRRRSR